MRGWGRLVAAGAALLGAGAGCGYAAIGAALWPSPDDDDPAPAVSPIPVANVPTPGGVSRGAITLPYFLTDGDATLADLTVDWTGSSDGGQSWSAFATATEATGLGSEGLTGLTTSPTGTAHTFVWNSIADAPTLDGLVRIRVTPREPGPPVVSGVAGLTNPFAVNNLNALPTAAVTTPVGNQTNAVPLAYTLADAESDTSDIQVEFAISTTGGASWTAFAPATESTGAPSEGTTGLATTPAGVAHTFVWNAFADAGGQDVLARLRLTPVDPGPPQRLGITVETVASGFPVLNKLIATVTGGSTNTLEFPGGVARDANGNLYVADTFNHRIQVLNTQASTITVAGVAITAGTLRPIAGTALAGFNGDHQPAAVARLNFPSGVAVSGTGDVFVADSLNHRIRRVDAATGYITTVVGTGAPGLTGEGGLATLAAVREPRGIGFDGGGRLWIGDTGNHQVRVVNYGASTVTLAGVAVAPNTIRRIAGAATGAAGSIGDGFAATSARLHTPWGLAGGGNGIVYVADSGNHALRVVNTGTVGVVLGGITVAGGTIRTLAGQNGTGGFAGDAGSSTLALLQGPKGVALDGNDNPYTCDTGNSRVRVVNCDSKSVTLAGVTITSGNIDTIAGGGSLLLLPLMAGSPGGSGGTQQPTGDGSDAIDAFLSAPEGLAVLAGGHPAIADTGYALLRAVNVGTSTITLAGLPIGAADIGTVAGTQAPASRLQTPAGLVRTGDLLFYADSAAHRVWSLNVKTGALVAIAGTGTPGFAGDAGTATSARVNTPRGLALDGNGNLYIADWANNRVRVVNRQAASITICGVTIGVGHIATIAGGGLNLGDGGAATSASVTNVPGVAVDGSGNLYLAHAGGNRIRMVGASSGTISTVAGSALAGFADGAATATAQMSAPEGVWADGSSGLVVADTANHAVRYVNLSASAVTITGVTVSAGDVATVAGIGPGSGGPSAGFNGDNQAATAAQLDRPTAAARDASGHLCLVDSGNQRIRRVDQATGLITTLGGTGTPGFNGDGIPPVNAHLNGPTQLLLDSATPANLFFADAANRRIRRFTP